MLYSGSCNEKKCVVLVFGEGGHACQAERLRLKLVQRGIESFVCTDDKSYSSYDKSFILKNPFPKTGRRVSFRNFISTMKVFGKLIDQRVNYNIKLMITLGPGICLPLAFFWFMLGGKLVHIETWSRFYSKSITGRVMYYIANEFFVQNHSLLKIYPRAKCKGKL